MSAKTTIVNIKTPAPMAEAVRRTAQAHDQKRIHQTGSHERAGARWRHADAQASSGLT
jgi:hypothetical protein